MLQRLFATVILTAIAFIFLSCSSTEAPILMGETRQVMGDAQELYRKASKADRDGKTKRAIKLYGKMVKQYPFAPSADQAGYRMACLLDQEGELEDAFDAYNDFLQRSPSSSLYSNVLNRQAKMAQAAVDGDLKSSFLGMKTKLSLDKSVEMLGKVRDHAPKSMTAAKAQYSIGEAYLSRGKYKESEAAFRKLVEDQPTSSLAPEALFKVGKILLENAERGNQNQANLDLSLEAFNDYLIQYPGHSRNSEARAMISTLKGRDVQRTFDVAEFYKKTGKKDSAKIYYNDVLKQSSSGKLHDAAKARLKELEP